MASPDDPRIAELLARRNGSNGTASLPPLAKTPPQVECKSCRLKRPATTDPCPWCQNDPTAPPPPADDAPAPRVRKPAAANKLCDRCGGKINTFSQKCPRCDTKAPTVIDAKPVKRLTVADLPAVSVGPEPAAEPEPTPTAEAQVQPEPVAAEPPADDRPATDTLCRKCRKRPVAPGTHAGKPRTTCQTCADRAAALAKARWDREHGVEPVEAPAASPPPAPVVDPEIAALAAVVAALKPLDEMERARVLDYAAKRFDPENEP